jgi:hypothetical protein
MPRLAVDYHGDGCADVVDLLEDYLSTRPAWMKDALCKEAGPEISWFDDDTEEAAIEVCRCCLARWDCFSWAVSQPFDVCGVWGASSEPDRARYRHPDEHRRPPVMHVYRPAVPRELDTDGRIIPRRSRSAQ